MFTVHWLSSYRSLWFYSRFSWISSQVNPYSYSATAICTVQLFAISYRFLQVCRFCFFSDLTLVWFLVEKTRYFSQNFPLCRFCWLYPCGASCMIYVLIFGIKCNIKGLQGWCCVHPWELFYVMLYKIATFLSYWWTSSSSSDSFRTGGGREGWNHGEILIDYS